VALQAVVLLSMPMTRGFAMFVPAWDGGVTPLWQLVWRASS
jgi:hypothetical protein